MLVEDDATLSFIVEDALKREGFDVVCASNGEAGLERFRESGADRKPFQILELVERIRALLKRNRPGCAEDTDLTVGDCRLDFASQRLLVGGDPVELSHTEAVIIDELFRHPNEVVEAKTLMYRIWQNDDYNNLNRLHGFIYKLRKYLSRSASLELLNVRGVGYKLAARM